MPSLLLENGAGKGMGGSQPQSGTPPAPAQNRALTSAGSQSREQRTSPWHFAFLIASLFHPLGGFGGQAPPAERHSWGGCLEHGEPHLILIKLLQDRFYDYPLLPTRRWQHRGSGNLHQVTQLVRGGSRTAGLRAVARCLPMGQVTRP